MLWLLWLNLEPAGDTNMAALLTTFSLQPGLHCFSCSWSHLSIHTWSLWGGVLFCVICVYQDEISIKIKHNLLAGDAWSLKRALENYEWRLKNVWVYHRAELWVSTPKGIKPFPNHWLLSVVGEPQIHSNLAQNSTANPGGSAAAAAFVQGREEAGAGAAPSSGYPRTSLVLLASSVLAIPAGLAWALPEPWAFWPSHISLCLCLCCRLLILQNTGKLARYWKYSGAEKTSGWKLVPTEDVVQRKEEILSLF